MSKINDIEDLIKAVRDYLKANLNTKISSINTAKGDSLITAITADNDHYVLAGDLYDIPNHTFVQIAILDTVEIKSNYTDYRQSVKILVEVAIGDERNASTYLRSLRYMRAILETMANFESSGIELDDVQISGAIPMSIKKDNRWISISGVIADIALG